MYAGTDKLEELDSLAASSPTRRHIDVEVAKGALPATVSIDFSFLYNPNCARSAHYNCPVAVDKVALAFTAGEKKPAGH